MKLARCPINYLFFNFSKTTFTAVMNIFTSYLSFCMLYFLQFVFPSQFFWCYTSSLDWGEPSTQHGCGHKLSWQKFRPEIDVTYQEIYDGFICKLLRWGSNILKGIGHICKFRHKFFICWTGNISIQLHLVQFLVVSFFVAFGELMFENSKSE